jgi:hypothetical protein
MKHFGTGSVQKTGADREMQSALVTLLASIARGIENLNATLTAALAQSQVRSAPPPASDRYDLQSISGHLARIADILTPPPIDKIGTPYVAKHLGCTSVWVAEMARLGQIPKPAIVPGTGNGKPWKFFRAEIDKWLKSR